MSPRCGICRILRRILFLVVSVSVQGERVPRRMVSP